MIQVEVNGRTYRADAEPRLLLSDFLRHTLGLTGTHVGCEHGVCGACTVRLAGRAVRSCLLLAVQADGLELETVEGLEWGSLQEAFRRNHALQCGFCTPGVLMAAQALLRDEPNASRERIREYLSGNYCRCTGYQAIVDAIEAVAKARAARI